MLLGSRRQSIIAPPLYTAPSFFSVERRQKDTDDIFADRASGLTVVKEKIERRKIQLDERLRALRGVRSGNEYEARARLRLVQAGD